MRKTRNATIIIFIISFILISSFTILLFSRSINSSTNIPYSIESDYFDIYNFNPVKNAPSKIIDQPSSYAYPQSRYEHKYIDMNILQGSPSLDGETLETTNKFIERTSISNDKYASIIPTSSLSNSSILKNYYVFMDKNGNNFMLPLSPDVDHFLSFDRIDTTSGSIIDDTDLQEISSSFNIGNNPYLFPNNETYIQVESSSSDTNLHLDVSTGGISVYNRSLYELYTVLDSHRSELIEGKFNPETFLKYFFNSDQGQYYEFSILNSIIQSRNRNFFLWFAEKCFTYENFLIGMGINLDEGYRIFAKFNPYSITRIYGKIAIYFDAPSSNPYYGEFQNYSIQCYNYVLENWVTIMTRKNSPLLQIENEWLYDSFTIQTNPWQYIYNFRGDSDLSTEFIKWRIVTNINRDPNDNLPIIMKVAGLWTSIEQEFNEFNAEFTFKVNETNIEKIDIESCKLLVEYHTENWDSLYDGIYITRSVGSHTFYDQYYNQNTESWEISSYSINYEVILDNGELYSHPIKDNQIGISIPDNMIEEDTTVRVFLHGKFSKYNRQGELSNPKVFFDKISMQYEYKKPIEIKRKTWINYNSLDMFYWSYDINITSNVVFLEFEYPSSWIFIDRYFSLVEKLDIGKNVSYMWINSNIDDSQQILYDDSNIRFNSQVLFFLGSGTYRFWFRSFNYITNVQVLDSKGSEYKIGDQISMDNKTIYNVTITDLWKNPLNKREYFGDMEIKFTGYSQDGKSTKTIGPFYGEQYNYTINNNVYWNKYYLNYTHTYSDGIFGNIRLDIYWHNEDYTEIGYKIFWLYIAYISNEKPIISLISPDERGKWGINITNYIILASWHLNTISSWAEVEGEKIELNRLKDAIDLNMSIPKELVSIPSYLKNFYWFAPVNTSQIGQNYNIEKLGFVNIEVTVGSIAQYGSTVIQSDNVTTDVELIATPSFILDPVKNVPIGNKQRIAYYCPDGILSMDIYIEGSGTSFKVSEIGGNENMQSSYLYKGYHTFLVPFRFSSPGVFNIKLVIKDDVGNQISIVSNQFSAIDDDDRLWITKILDDLVEISVLWFAYLSIGAIYLKNKKSKMMIK